MTDIARADDPVESHEAAQELTASGKRDLMQKVALSAIRRFPGLTSNELEKAAGYTDGKLRKRLVELEHRGDIRRGESRPSKVSGKNNVTWWPTVKLDQFA